MRVFVCVVVCAALTRTSPAQELGRTSKITPFVFNVAEPGVFGSTASLGPDFAVIGSPDGYDGGSIYVMRRDGVLWRTVQVLHPASPGPLPAAEFGGRVSHEGSVIMAGAYRESMAGDFVGAVYVFEPDSGWAWFQTARLAPSDSPGDAAFGAAIALSEGVLAVGAPLVADPLFPRGRVYTYQRDGTGWTELASVSGDPSLVGGAFGDSVALAGGRLFVGASEEYPGGAAYVFERAADTWTQVDRFEAPDSMLAARFGRALVPLEPWLLVGAPAAGGTAIGSVYVYRSDDGALAWEETFRPESTFLNYGVSVTAQADEWLLATPLIGFHREDTAWSEVAVFDHEGVASPDADWVAIDGDCVLAYDRFSGQVGGYSRIDGAWHQTSLFRAMLPDARSGEGVGTTVATDGTDVFMAMPAHTEETGAVYVVERLGRGWRQRQKLDVPWSPAPTPAPGDALGTALAVDDGWLLIGAPGANDGDGMVYALQKDAPGWQGWHVSDRVNGDPGGRLGTALAMSAGRAVVAETGDPAVPRVRTFRIVGSEWWPTATLSRGAEGAAAGYGAAVDIDRDTIVVGAPRALVGGAAYVYERVDVLHWAERATLRVDGARPDSEIGASVAVAERRVAVGAPGDLIAGADAGAVYVFEHRGGEWMQAAAVRADDTDANDRFGASVSLEGGWLAVGAPGAGVAGAVYLFRWTPAGFVQVGRYNGHAAAGSGVGTVVALAPSTLVAAVPGDDAVVEDGGAALLIDVVVSDLPLGHGCAAGGECESRQCRDDVCCNEPCPSMEMGACAACAALFGAAQDGECVVDASLCPKPIDAGVSDAAVSLPAPDSGSMPDAGAAPAGGGSSGGCGCRATPRGGPGWVLALVSFAMVRRRRHRSPSGDSASFPA